MTPVAWTSPQPFGKRFPRALATDLALLAWASRGRVELEPRENALLADPEPARLLAGGPWVSLGLLFPWSYGREVVSQVAYEGSLPVFAGVELGILGEKTLLTGWGDLDGRFLHRALDIPPARRPGFPFLPQETRLLKELLAAEGEALAVDLVLPASSGGLVDLYGGNGEKLEALRRAFLSEGFTAFSGSKWMVLTGLLRHQVHSFEELLPERPVLLHLSLTTRRPGPQGALGSGEERGGLGPGRGARGSLPGVGGLPPEGGGAVG